MTSETKAILDGLIKKTAAGQTPWIEASELTSALYWLSAQLIIDKARVVIYQQSSNSPITWRVHNANDTPIISEQFSKEDPYYPAVQEMLVQAVRRARKIDEALGSLRNFLRS